MWRGAWAGLATVLATVTLGGAAQGQDVPDPIVVRPQVGMAGIRLGDPSDLLEQRLGAPVRVSADSYPGPVSYVQWFYPGLRVSVIGYQGQETVLVLTTSSPRATTPRAVGVGSPLGALRRAYPGVRCSTYAGSRTCSLGEPGGRQTSFAIRNRRVREISVGEVF